MASMTRRKAAEQLMAKLNDPKEQERVRAPREESARKTREFLASLEK